MSFESPTQSVFYSTSIPSSDRFIINLNNVICNKLFLFEQYTYIIHILLYNISSQVYLLKFSNSVNNDALESIKYTSYIFL